MTLFAASPPTPAQQRRTGALFPALDHGAGAPAQGQGHVQGQRDRCQGLGITPSAQEAAAARAGHRARGAGLGNGTRGWPQLHPGTHSTRTHGHLDDPQGEAPQIAPLFCLSLAEWSLDQEFISFICGLDNLPQKNPWAVTLFGVPSPNWAWFAALGVLCETLNTPGQLGLHVPV